MAFLATLAVDDLESSADGSISLLVAHDFHRVHTSADEIVLVSARLRKSLRVRSGLVSDQRANFASLVGMLFLIHRHANELVRREVVVKPLVDLLSQLLPVAISASQGLGKRLRVAHLDGVPHGLAAGASDILGCTRHGDEIWFATLDSESIGGLLLFLPRLLVVERVELDIVARASAVHDGYLSVEECQNLISILNIVLVGCDGNNLVPSQVLVPDPLLQVASISQRVGPREDHAVYVGVRPRGLSHLQVQFKLIMSS